MVNSYESELQTLVNEPIYKLCQRLLIFYFVKDMEKCVTFLSDQHNELKSKCDKIKESEKFV